MAEHIAEVIFIDMERSEVDTDRSKPEKGMYFFKGDPFVITPDSYKRAETCPDYVYKWCTISFEGRTLKKWIYQGWEFVQHGEDRIFPQGADLDGEGHWSFGDGVLMKMPLERYMNRKAKELRSADEAKKSVRRKLDADIAASDPKLGRGAVLTEEERERFLSDDSIGLP